MEGSEVGREEGREEGKGGKGVVLGILGGGGYFVDIYLES